MRPSVNHLANVALGLVGLVAPVAAQTADTLGLVRLRAAAEAVDPRSVEPELMAEAARLRIEAIAAEALPQLALTGQATIQSAVPEIAISLPNGSTPSVPKEQARAQVEADWAVFDGGRRRLRADLERARLAETTAGVDVALYPLRDAVTEAFFGALLAQSQVETLTLAADDLQARLDVLRAQVRQGAALAASADVVEAELIGVRQRIAEAAARRHAAYAVLARLTETNIRPSTVLVPPNLDAVLARAAEQGEVLSDEDDLDALEGAARPEFARLNASRRRAEAEARLAASATRPSVSLFGQAGVGRPNPFDFLSSDVEPYALAGVRVRWAPVDWGRSRREAEAARLQADVARTEAEALAQRLRRDIEADAADVRRLREALPLDDRVVALREEALRVAVRQLDEGVVLPDVYTDRLTDLADARLTRERHRLELARAQARLLSTLGLFPDAPSDR